MFQNLRPPEVAFQTYNWCISKLPCRSAQTIHCVLHPTNSLTSTLHIRDAQRYALKKVTCVHGWGARGGEIKAGIRMAGGGSAQVLQGCLSQGSSMEAATAVAAAASAAAATGTAPPAAAEQRLAALVT